MQGVRAKDTGPTEDKANRSNTGTGHQYDKWSSVTKEFLLDEFESENWGIFPDNAKIFRRLIPVSARQSKFPRTLEVG